MNSFSLLSVFRAYNSCISHLCAGGASIFLLAVVAVIAAPREGLAQQAFDGGGAINRGARTSEPTGGYLDGGGPAYHGRRGMTATTTNGFLSGGGSITDAPDIGYADRQTGFLSDGGSISTVPDFGFSDGHSSFLEDGGSVTTRPDILVDGQLLGTRSELTYEPTSPVTIENRNSFTLVTTDHGARSTSARSNAGLSRHLHSSSSKIIDVASERLDRYGSSPSSVTMISPGGVKIIRFTQEQPKHDDRSAGLGDLRLAANEGHARPGEPWTPQWLETCTRAHRSFDPNFGTFTDAQGRHHFCEGN